jgi:subtilisin family serine protease
MMDYGSSLNQLEQINVPAVHDLGYHGEGILIGILDTGFYLAHEAFMSTRVQNEWDFIFDDGNSFNEEEDSPAQHSHGTEVLSVIGGARDGQLYGPAYGATFLLAKTEDIRSETAVEEDYWTEGIEWAEQMGADIVTSSLGYADWYSYDDGDYNGDIAVTTRAADLAASKGIVVCNAVGNEGQQAGSIVAPADADSILACGAVDANGNLAGFSSIGPTNDGRIKPEVVAKGRATYMVNPYKPSEYLYGNGTSYSTPLVAGCAALVLQAHPDWTPMMVREALMMTASRADRPGNYFGWGIVDCLKAINYQFTSIADEQEGRALPDHCELLQNYPNPFNPITTIQYQIPMTKSQLHLTLKIFNVMGQEVRTLVDEMQDAGYYSVMWDGRDTGGRDVSSGFYVCRLETDSFAATRTMVLLR